MTRILKQRGVLRAEYLKTLETGREVIEAAERAAAGIRERAERAGHEDGMARASATIIEAQALRDRWLVQAHGDLARLALEAAAALHERARELDPSIVAEVCADALERVAGARRIRIRVSPEDAPSLEGMTGPEGVPVALVEDDSIRAGGCVVETELGSVDARLETRLDALGRALDEVLGRHAWRDG